MCVFMRKYGTSPAALRQLDFQQKKHSFCWLRKK